MKDFRLNPDWYRTKYNLASERLSLATSGDATKRGERLTLARECAMELLTQIELTLEGRRRGKRADPELRDFIANDLRPNAKLLLTQIEVAEQGPGEAERREGDGDDEDGRSPAPAATATPEFTVEAVLGAAPHTSELDYSIARLYAQAEERGLARQYLNAAVDRAEPSEWQALAHRIVRDPLLGDVASPSPSLGAAEGFSEKLAVAREDAGVEAEAEPRDLD